MPQYPTPEEIALLSSLKKEEQRLARETSHAVINIPWGALFAFSFNPTVGNFIKYNIYVPLTLFFLKRTAPEHREVVAESLFQAIMTVGLISILLFLYASWQLLARLVLSIFPSGTATTQQTLKAKQLKNKDLLKKEVMEAITELQQHVQKLKRKNIIISASIIGFALVADIPLYILFKVFVPVIVRCMIALPIVFWPIHYLLKKRNEINLSARFSEFEKKIKNIFLNIDVSILKDENSKPILIALRYNLSAKTNFIIDGKKIKIKNTDLLDLIYAFCEEKKWKNYFIDKNLYIEYQASFPQLIDKLSQEFSQKILKFAQENNLIKLYQPVLLQSETETVSETKTEQSSTAYITNQMTDNNQDNNDVKKNITQKKKKNNQEKDATVINNTDTLPKTIQWQRCRALYNIKSISHFTNRAYILHDDRHPDGTIFATIDERIFELATPYMSNKKNKKVVNSNNNNNDDVTISKTGKMLQKHKQRIEKTKNRITAILDRGAVYPAGKIKSKQGGVGIVDSGGIAYQTISGRNEPTSAYKIKLPNNLRIFCSTIRAHQIEFADGKARLAYHFNGIGLGH